MEILLMNVTAIIKTLLHGNQLKQTARTGWAQRGVPDSENVAAHSYGVAFTALILAQVVEEPLDQGRVLAMALLHDLSEGLTSDIPTPAWGYLPAGTKPHMERTAMLEILKESPGSAALLAQWQELHEAKTAEARLVHDADKLELHLQALVYQEQTGNRRLSEFWTREPRFYFPQTELLYEELCRRRVSG
jgi:putative hydrolase of HD superfamily